MRVYLRDMGSKELDFGGAYRRAYLHCALCGHWFSQHDIDCRVFYAGAYVAADLRRMDAGELRPHHGAPARASR